jgi:hypothetical protein
MRRLKEATTMMSDSIRIARIHPLVTVARGRPPSKKKDVPEASKSSGRYRPIGFAARPQRSPLGSVLAMIAKTIPAEINIAARA